MSRSRQKGTAWETAVVTYLRGQGWPYVERRALAGKNDRGDIAGIPGLVIECKATKEHDLAGWCRELETEIVNDGATTGAVVIKRRNQPTAAAYTVLTLDRYTALLKEAGY